MKSITGVGEKKYEEFGETFIKIIRNFIKENEGFDRKFYAGYLGAIDENNNFNL